jgi:hypothetical protein
MVQGARFNEIKHSYWSKTLIWVPKHLNIGLGPSQIKLWFILHGIILEEKPIGANKKRISMRAHGLGNQNVS